MEKLDLTKFVSRRMAIAAYVLYRLSDALKAPDAPVVWIVGGMVIVTLGILWSQTRLDEKK